MSELPADLLDSYHKTTYRIFAKNILARNISVGGDIDLRIGQLSCALDRLLKEADVSRWACLTAHNPGSTCLEPNLNSERQANLLAVLAAEKYDVLPGRSLADAGGWPDEDSALVLGISLERARRFASDFGQCGFLFGEMGGPVRLIICSSE